MPKLADTAATGGLHHGESGGAHASGQALRERANSTPSDTLFRMAREMSRALPGTSSVPNGAAATSDMTAVSTRNLAASGSPAEPATASAATSRCWSTA